MIHFNVVDLSEHRSEKSDVSFDAQCTFCDNWENIATEEEIKMNKKKKIVCMFSKILLTMWTTKNTVDIGHFIIRSEQ